MVFSRFPIMIEVLSLVLYCQSAVTLLVVVKQEPSFCRVHLYIHLHIVPLAFGCDEQMSPSLHIAFDNCRHTLSVSHPAEASFHVATSSSLSILLYSYLRCQCCGESVLSANAFLTITVGIRGAPPIH